MQNFCKAFLLYTLIFRSLSSDNEEKLKELIPKGISFNEFTELLQTDINEVLIAAGEKDLSEKEHLWTIQTKLDWNTSKNTRGYPFILCHDDVKLSGYERQASLEVLDLVTIYHSSNRTCFMTFGNTSYILNISASSNGLIKIQPMSFAMKLLHGSHSILHTILNETNKGNNFTKKIRNDIHIDVMVCPGVLNETMRKILKKEEEEEEEEIKLRKRNLDESLDSPKEENSTDTVFGNSKDDAIFSPKEFIRNKILTFIKASFEHDLFWKRRNTSSSASKGNQNKNFFESKILDQNYSKVEKQCSSIYALLQFELEQSNYANYHILTIDLTSIMEISLETRECVVILVLCMTLQEEICSIQPRFGISSSNHVASWLVQGTGIPYHVPFYNAGLTGKGEVVAVSDSGIDLDHCYFSQDGDMEFGRKLDLTRRKVVSYDAFIDQSDYLFGHGTHVAGSICGNPPSSSGGISKGIAYDARIAFIDIGHSDGGLVAPKVKRLLHTGIPHAKIHSASWGSDYNGYGTTANLIDDYVYHHNDELLVVFAAGNHGDEHSSVVEPSTAKNVIAVGASQSYSNEKNNELNPNRIADFSSRGPTLDGRTKPDIIAPGQWISSAAAIPSQIGECDPVDKIPPKAKEQKAGLISFQGTSMATPIVSGAAAMIRQYLRQGFYPTGVPISANAITSPSSALIKAILLNGAQPLLDGEEYDSTQNFGRVSLADSIYVQHESNAQLKLWDRVEIKQDETISYYIRIDMSKGCTSSSFTATLVWNDYPGVAGCASCLMNDLDLSVFHQKKQFFPNGLSSKDSINNVERVRFSNVKHGDFFTIKISGFSLFTPTQKYSLVATGCFGGPGRMKEISDFNVFQADSNGTIEWCNMKIILAAAFTLGSLITLCLFICYCADYSKQRKEIGYSSDAVRRSSVS